MRKHTHRHPAQQIYGNFGIGLEETRRRLLSLFSGAAEFPLESCVLAPAAPPTQPHSPPSHRQASQKARRRKTTAQGAYGAICAVNRQPWNPQRRGSAQVRTPKDPLSRVPRQPPDEHLGGPHPQVGRKLRLRQGAISNENAALTWRRARFQGINFFKASGGEVGVRKHTHTDTQRNKSTGILA